MCGDYEKAYDLYKKKDYTKAFREMSRVAACPHNCSTDTAQASLFLGRMWEFGWGTKANISEAKKRYKQAGARGAVNAYVRLAEIHGGSIGQSRNPDKEFKYWEKAYLHGNKRASLELADYANKPNARGITVAMAVSMLEAVALATDPADQALRPLACNKLVLIHEQGFGGADADELRFIWLLKAAGLGDPEAMYKLYECYSIGRGTAVNPEESLEWLQLAADTKKKALANLSLGLFYLAGVPGVLDKSPTEALAQFRVASQLDSPSASLYIGIAYKVGLLGLKSDLKQARLFFAKAATLGDPEAQWQYGLELLRITDVAGATEQLQRAIEGGCQDAVIPLVKCCFLTQRVPRASELAHKTCRTAARAGHAWSHFIMAMSMAGRHCRVKAVHALESLQAAVALDYAPAISVYEFYTARKHELEPDDGSYGWAVYEYTHSTTMLKCNENMAATQLIELVPTVAELNKVAHDEWCQHMRIVEADLDAVPEHKLV